MVDGTYPPEVKVRLFGWCMCDTGGRRETGLAQLCARGCNAHSTGHDCRLCSSASSPLIVVDGSLANANGLCALLRRVMGQNCCGGVPQCWAARMQ